MYLHPETYRWLAYERINGYLHEAAIDRRTRLAAAGGEWLESRPVSSAAARLLVAVVRTLAQTGREKKAA